MIGFVRARAFVLQEPARLSVICRDSSSTRTCYLSITTENPCLYVAEVLRIHSYITCRSVLVAPGKESRGHPYGCDTRRCRSAACLSSRSASCFSSRSKACLVEGRQVKVFSADVTAFYGGQKRET